MDHNADHAEHHEVHLPDPSIWPLVAGVAALMLGAALVFWARDGDNGFAGPLLGAAVVVALASAGGWAYEDGRMKRKAELHEIAQKRDARYTQVLTFAVADGQALTARGPSGVISALEDASNQLRDTAGCQDMRIVASPATSGPTQVLVETTWAAKDSMSAYDESRQGILDILTAHETEVLPGSIQTFDMEVVRDTKDVSFRFSLGSSVALIAGLIVGGLMIGLGLSLFQEEAVASTGGGGETGVPPNTLIMTDNKFARTTFELPANADVTVNAVNRGRVPHNLAFYVRENGDLLAPGAKGTILDGGKSEELKFHTPAVGSYFYRCDVHPTEMKGTLQVIDAPPPSPAGSPAAGTPAAGTPAAGTPAASPTAR